MDEWMNGWMDDSWMFLFLLSFFVCWISQHRQDIFGKFDGYLSPSQDLKFADVPSGLAAISRVPLLFHCCSIAVPLLFHCNVPLQRAIATCHCNVPLLFHCNVGWFGMSCCERRISPSAALLTASTGSPATSALATGAGRSRLLGRLGLVGLLLSTFAGGFPYNGIRNGTRPTFPYNSKFDTRHYIVIPCDTTYIFGSMCILIWSHVATLIKFFAARTLPSESWSWPPSWTTGAWPWLPWLPCWSRMASQDQPAW